ncbi:hypothetical protein ICW40_03800 [Actinotalea ferrariae]|uniref:hypothetical protein n=1 Tax=Actinotalea ferrariae TaxID=1386098 RepID=UPI001C8B2DA2|nr:hypothetical protein [Actinotalea ferrariae]MBX9243929.1 hypothetical protein [Actinotalea ferrariae]
MLSGCLPGTTGQPAGPKPEKTTASGEAGGAGEADGGDLEWDDPFDLGEESERLHAVMAGYDEALEAWRATESTGDLAAAQQGALVYAEAVGAMLGELEVETFSPDYRDSADSVLKVARDAVASAEAAAVAPKLEEYDTAVKAGYGDVGARTELKVLLLWV